MKNLQQYKYIIITLIIIMTAFLWYEVRPSMIIRKCQLWSIIETDRQEKPDRIDARYFFGKCLREYGLNNNLNKTYYID